MFKKNKGLQSNVDGNNKEVSQNMANEPIEPQNNAPKQKAIKTRSLNSWVAQPLFATLFCLVLAYILM